MPRLTKQLPKYRKHRASGKAFVELNGHRHYLGPHGTKASKLEYDRLTGEWLANGRQPLNSSNDLLLVELCLKYWEFAEGHYQKNGRSTRVKETSRYVANELLHRREPILDKSLRDRLYQEFDTGRTLLNEAKCPEPEKSIRQAERDIQYMTKKLDSLRAILTRAGQGPADDSPDRTDQLKKTSTSLKSIFEWPRSGRHNCGPNLARCRRQCHAGSKPM